MIADYGGDLAAIHLVADHADHAVLAWAAYGEPEALARAKERGWTPMRDLVVENPGPVGDTVATLFVDADGDERVLAFRGTEPKQAEDWVTNFGVLVPGPMLRGQVEAARRLADEAVAAVSDVVFVGHSLGGRLAKAARVQTGNPAVTFNVAPLLLSGEDAGAEEVAADLIEFRSPDDPATQIEAGRRVVVANLEETGTGLAGDFINSDYTHEIKTMVEAMSVIRDVRNKGWFRPETPR